MYVFLKVNKLLALNLSIKGFFNDVFKRQRKQRKAILFLLRLACWKETLDIASWVIYTVIVVRTDYRTSSLKSRGS